MPTTADITNSSPDKDRPSIEGDCCSRLNYCGRNGSYCGDGCQSDFGVCGDSNISSDGSCGGSRGLTCRGSAEGNCCSARGFCGQTTDYCGDGCQAEFGDCYKSNSTSSRGSSSTSGTQTPSSSSDSEEPSSTQEEQQGASEEDDGSDDKKALKIGLGVGIPVGVLAIVGLAAFLFLRKRRQSGSQGDDETEDAEKKPVSPSHELDAPQKPVELVGNTQTAVELPADNYRR
ncbi:hypothetical protein SAPIO_CDS6604 [Scedosporium apiospermum]|uniref:Chitin-binding type-1 domain-containing protein n=1 Tax=Pseudallescheria apiosperma TaxID=563466 RepID=A0A084G3J6_PSEDA|nr:uncharacterized protein SAPIO_CDS6604 [Scedosporium apiospermum]KEZ41908.1 hypothetical protein SAPIO_CDS6604 [Scedosporium apiospermum]